MASITVQCSPDADDLFMMWALLEGLIPTGGLQLTINTSPTDQLNRLAGGDGPDVCAISIAHYPKVAEHYRLLPHGGSMGEGYGPVVIAASDMRLEDLSRQRIAVPGLTTTAAAVLRMMVADFKPVITPITPYQLIFDALRRGEVGAGLIIHEGRLTYEDEGFVKIVDLGEWWAEQTGGLPLPLGANAIRRDLGPERIAQVSTLLQDSIRYALAHRERAIQWLLDRGGALRSPAQVSRYLNMYANQRTLDYGADGREAIRAFFRHASAAGALEEPVIDFAP